MNEESVRINLTSPPDRNLLTCEIMVDNEQMAELNQENGVFTFEIYPRPDGQPWTISCDLLIEILTKAKQRLLERSRSD